METDVEMLQWYDTNKLAIPIIYRFTRIIFSIPLSQIENEQNFSLVGVIGRARRSSFTVNNLSMLIFTNKNRDASHALKKSENMNLFEVDSGDYEEELALVEEFINEDNSDDDNEH